MSTKKTEIDCDEDESIENSARQITRTPTPFPVSSLQCPSGVGNEQPRPDTVNDALHPSTADEEALEIQVLSNYEATLDNIESTNSGGAPVTASPGTSSFGLFSPPRAVRFEDEREEVNEEKEQDSQIFSTPQNE